MDLTYDFSRLHTSNGVEEDKWEDGGPPKRLKTSQSHSTIFQAATQLRKDPFGAVGAVAGEALRLQFDVLSGAAYYTFHPGQAADDAWQAANTYLSRATDRPLVSTHEDSKIPDALLVNRVRKLKKIEHEDAQRLARRHRLQAEREFATSWREYSVLSTELGKLEGDEEWKRKEGCELYDFRCLKDRLKRLERARNDDDLEQMMHLVRTELTRDLGGICNRELHQKTRVGTKYLIERYTTTVREVFDRVIQACAYGDGRLRKINVELQLKETRQSFGRTALLLSGGGTLGMNHIGTIKALHEAGALPRVISGSSAGSIVAAVLGVTNDNELLNGLDSFCEGDLGVFVGRHEKMGLLARLLHYAKYRSVFDENNLRGVMVDLLGTTTFLEAYHRTRRILNITVSSATIFESNQVLNYTNAPNVLIYTAVVASCAVPGGFNAAGLLCKDPRTKRHVPWDASTLHIDGSIEGDIPISRLSAEFDVNHFVVSQVNPHVVPFLKNSVESNGKLHYWHTAATLAKDEAVRTLENLAEIPCLAYPMTKASSVLNQRYSGDITVFPADPLGKFWTILGNPTPEFMEEAKLEGQRATWPAISLIKSHLEVEIQIDIAVHKMAEHISFSDSARDLRRLQIPRHGIPRHPSGRRGRPGSSKSHQSTKSLTIFDDKETVRSVSFIFDNASRNELAIKVPGYSSPSATGSRSGSVSLDSDDESDASDAGRNTKSSKRDAKLIISQSLPGSPRKERKRYFDTPRSGSPAPPMSLTMTPVTPRENSPEMTTRKRPNRGWQSIPIIKSPPRGLSPSSRKWKMRWANMIDTQIPNKLKGRKSESPEENSNLSMKKQ